MRFRGAADEKAGARPMNGRRRPFPSRLLTPPPSFTHKREYPTHEWYPRQLLHQIHPESIDEQQHHEGHDDDFVGDVDEVSSSTTTSSTTTTSNTHSSTTTNST